MNFDNEQDSRPPVSRDSGRNVEGRARFLEGRESSLRARPAPSANSLGVHQDEQDNMHAHSVTTRDYEYNSLDNPGQGARQSAQFWDSRPTSRRGSRPNSAVPRSATAQTPSATSGASSVRSDGGVTPWKLQPKSFRFQKSVRQMKTEEKLRRIEEEHEEETWINQMFPQKMRKARFGISMRIAIGLIVSLIFFITPWFNSPVKCIGPIITVLYAFHTPPYLGSAFMCLTIFSMAFLTSVIASGFAMYIGASYFDGDPSSETQLTPVIMAWGVLFLYWLVFIPPLRTSHASVTTMVLMIIIGVPLYVFVPSQDFLMSGTAFAIDTAGLSQEQFYDNLCNEIDLENNPNGPIDLENIINGFEQGFNQVLAIGACSYDARQAFLPGVQAGQSICIPWTAVGDATGVNTPPSLSITGIRQEILFNYWNQAPQELLEFAEIWNDSQFCYTPVDGNPDIFALSMTPGNWILEYSFFYLEFGAGALSWIVLQAIISAACIFIMFFLPPARFATDHLRTLMRDQVLRLREDRLFGCLPGGHENQNKGVLNALDLPNSVPDEPLPCDNTIGPTKGRKRLFSADEPLFAAMDTVAAVATVEINLTDPGPFVAIWPSYTRIIPLIRTFSNQMALTNLIADLCNVHHMADESQAKLLRELDQLVFEMAFCLSLRPTAGGSSVFNVELLCIKLEEKCDAVKNSAYRWVNLPHAKTSEQRILVEGHRLAAMQMAGSACAMAEGIMTMMKAHSEPSWKGLGTSLGGLWIPLGRLGLDMIMFWGKVLASPWTVGWKGHFAWWKDSRVASVIQMFIALALIFVVFGALEIFRQFNEYPVNSQYVWPGGRMGQWAAFPVAIVLMTSWHGTASRAPMRVLSAVIGAILGIPALILLIWGQYGQISPFENEFTQDIGTNGLRDDSNNTLARFLAVLYLGIVVFFCSYTGVDTTGRFSAYGAFHTQYGYGSFIAAFYAVGIATEGYELVGGMDAVFTETQTVVVAPYSIMGYVAMRIIEYLIAMALVVVAASLWPIQAGSSARKESSKSLRRLGRALNTAVASWRGDMVEDKKKEEARVDSLWSDQARGRGNNFILEMDCFGRLRHLFKEQHFFTLWSGDISDLVAVRTLHNDMMMFINQLMKGCRAPISETPQFLEHLSFTVDEWASACERRVGYICDSDYPKLLGIRTPTDEALAVHDALHKALPDLILLAEQEAEELEEKEEAERQAKKAAKKKEKEQHQELLPVADKSPSTSTAVGVSSACDDGGKAAREKAREQELEDLKKEHHIVQKARLAEVQLEADQRWQLLIALMTGLERSIFAALPDDIDFSDMSDVDFDNPYDYEYARAMGSNTGQGDVPVAGSIVQEEPKEEKQPAMRLADLSRQRRSSRRGSGAQDAEAASQAGSGTQPAKRSSSSRVAGEEGVNYGHRSGDMIKERNNSRGRADSLPPVRPEQEGMSLERPYDPSMDAADPAGHNQFEDAWNEGGGTPPGSDPPNAFADAAIGVGIGAAAGLAAGAAVSAATRRSSKSRDQVYDEDDDITGRSTGRSSRRRRSSAGHTDTTARSNNEFQPSNFEDPPDYDYGDAEGVVPSEMESSKHSQKKKKKKRRRKKTEEGEYVDGAESMYYGDSVDTFNAGNTTENNYMYV